MPDAGDFETRKAPASPASWGEAFAALPGEAPAAGGWQRLEARLPAENARRARRRWPLWLAAAASLALVLAIPVRMLSQEEVDATASAESAAPPSPAAIAAAPKVATDSGIAEATPAATPVIARTAAHREPRIAPAQRPIRTAASPADATRIAAAATPIPVDLDPLYAQSAQLESLLALARDERVASGTSAALSGELDDRVAAIDATLIQSGLSDAQRADLWGQRIDALQQLVGIETTNRLYAARGQSYHAALVSID